MGAEAWVTDLVEWLRSAAVETITARLKQGFFGKSMVEALQELEVGLLLKASAQDLRPADETWTASGELLDVCLLSLEIRQLLAEAQTTLALEW